MRPVSSSHPVTAAFGKPGSWAAGYHPGIDFGCAVGTKVVAPADATIISAGWGGSIWGAAYGYMIVGQSKGTDGRTYRWATCHHRKGGLSVSAGQKVKAGQTIGYSGNTGNTTGPHVHLEVRDGGYGYWDHVNPAVILNVGGSTAAPKGTKAHSGRYKVNASVLNARTGPGTSYPVAASHKKGTVVTTDRVSADGKWLRSSGSGHWYYSQYLTAAPKAVASESKAHKVRYKITASVLNGRSGPGTNYKVRDTAKKGETFTSDLISTDKKWVRSGTSKNWWASEYLEAVPVEKPTDNNPVPHAERYKVTASALNARTGPGTTYDVAATHPQGTIVTTKYRSADGKWVQSSGSGHWYALEYLALAPKDSTTPPTPPAPVDPVEPEDGDETPGGTAPLVDLIVLPRSAWTKEPNARAGDPLVPADVTATVVHYPADGDVSYAHLTRDDVARLLAAYRKHHIEGNGWKDIGYNYAIDQAGRRWELTGDVHGAHAGDEGNDLLGVLLVLGNNERPSEAMLLALMMLRLEKRAKFPAMLDVLGHREVPGNSTSCPGEKPLATVHALNDLLATTSMSGPSAAPKPPSTTGKQTFRIGTLNVIRWRLGKVNERKYDSFKDGLPYYPDRVKGLASVVKKMAADAFTTTESGQYKDADALSTALGTGWANVLHGDAAGDITQAVHWETPLKMLEEGSYVTGEPREVNYHNTATWALLQDEVMFLLVGNHADHRARGTNGPSQYDLGREEDAEVLIVEAEKIAARLATKYGVKNIPVVFAGDFNQDRNDAYDGIGRAFAKHGYVDAEEIAPGTTGPVGTLNGLKPNSDGERRVDAVFVKEGTPVGVMITVDGYPYTDHNGVTVPVTLTND